MKEEVRAKQAEIDRLLAELQQRLEEAQTLANASGNEREAALVTQLAAASDNYRDLQTQLDSMSRSLQETEKRCAAAERAAAKGEAAEVEAAELGRDIAGKKLEIERLEAALQRQSVDTQRRASLSGGEREAVVATELNLELEIVLGPLKMLEH